jgi:HAD superfamily hydrolase (TIGR01484 family)
MTSNQRASKIFAIISDYDGTLCPTGSIRRKDQNKVPPELADVLSEISRIVPICILSSKDYSFLREKVPFANIVSCILGIETLSIDELHSKIKSRRLLLNDKLLQNNAKILEEIANDVSSRFPDIAIERKLTSDGHLAGVTFDWRDQVDWKKYSDSVPNYLRGSLTKILRRQSRTAGIYVQTYSSHPFVDLYTARCDKGVGFDVIASELEFSPEKGKIMYLGDSENDNPAFRKAGVSIGICSEGIKE